MSYLLHIETATEVCSVAVSDGPTELSRRESAEPYSHARDITLLIARCLEEAGLGLSELVGVSVSTGPGSYTALRVGASTAKGICYALGKPLIAVDTLQSLALEAARHLPGKPLYCPMIDARRMEVYLALFDPKNRRLEDPRSLVISADAFDAYWERGEEIVFCGNGAPKCRPVLSAPGASFVPVVCSASLLIPLAWEAFQKGQWADLAYFEPHYQKPPNITTPKKRPF